MSVKITYIGHATTLLEWPDFRCLTDPVFSSRVLCFKRIKPLGINPSQLPKLNAIFISHAHYDHLDLFSFKYIPSDVLIFVPEGMANAIASFVNNPIIELATWSRYALGPDTEVCAVPAKHPGGRFICPVRYRKCHGYIIRHKDEHVYFAGDTGYGSHFADIRAAFPIQLALLPAARLGNSLFSIKRHLGIKEWVQAWIDLGKPNVVPIHWGTFFKLFNDPNRISWSLKHESQKYPEFRTKMHLLEPGESHVTLT